MKSSYLLDSLKLFINGKYIISDSDLALLSDIIVNNNLEKVCIDGSFLELMHLVDRGHITLPISYKCLEERWNTGVNVNFVQTLRSLMDSGLVVVRNITSSVFHNNTNIMKSDLDMISDDFYHVIYATDKYKSVMDEISYLDIVLTTESELNESVALEDVGKHFSDFTKRLISNIRTLGVNIGLESCSIDDSINALRINITYGIDSSSVSDKEIVSQTKKSLSRDKNIKELETYLDDNGIVFLSLAINRDALKHDLTRLITKVAQVIQDVRQI